MNLLAAFLLCAALPQDYYPPPDSAGGWRTLKEAGPIRDVAGMDLAKLDQAWEQTQRCTQNAGLVVVRRGYLVYRKRRRAFATHPTWPRAAKAFTSIACGIMLSKKDAIPTAWTRGLHRKYLPGGFRSTSAPRRDHPGQLLCMTAGYHGEGRRRASRKAR
jgi:hypothetical protein